MDGAKKDTNKPFRCNVTVRTNEGEGFKLALGGEEGRKIYKKILDAIIDVSKMGEKE